MSRFFCLLVCLGVCSWTSVPGADRDSSAVASAIAEHLSPTGLFLQEVYRNPAAQYRHYDHNLTRIELSGSYKQEEHAVIDQIGQGFRYAAFHADSYIRRGNHTIWGSAGYRTGRTMHTVWNESADFELLYPYVWGDSVGGSLSSEHYTFEGGYARRFGRWTWGIQADYRAEIEYRTVDPRPRNVVSDLKLSTGTSLAVGKRYTVGLHIEAQIYRQSSSMRFLAPLGGPKEYQMLGLGMYSVRFSTGGDQSSVYYKGGSYGIGVELFPNDGQGWFALLHYSRWRVKRILPDAPYQKLPLTTLNDSRADVEFGWIRHGFLHRWGFKAHGTLANRRGTEHIYGDASGSSNYPLLGSVQQYLNNRNRAEVVCLWGMERPNGWSLYTECNGQYAAFEARYLDPSRRMQFSKAGGGADVMVGIRRGHGMLRFTLCGSYLATLSSDLLTTGLDPESAIGQALRDTYARLRSGLLLYGVSLHWSHIWQCNTAFYVDGTWKHGSFDDGNRVDYARIACGIAF